MNGKKIGIEEFAKTVDQTDYDIQTSLDNSLAEGIFNDVSNMAGQAIENDSLTSYRLENPQNTLLSTCATITNTPNGSGGGDIIINFGSSNCLCLDDRYRRGIININFTGAYSDSGTVITINFESYFVGKDSTQMFEVAGSKSVINNGYNIAGNLNFSISVNGQLINANGISMDWSSVRNRELIFGANTPLNWIDDEYVITGSASGTNFEGNSFTVNITNGLHIRFCPFITQGTFELIATGKLTRIFDYGNGVCDNNAKVTIGGRTFQIILR